MKQIIYSTVPAFFVLATACGDITPPAPAAPAAVKVSMIAAEEGKAVYYEEYPATVTPLNQIELRPQVSGFITGIHFKDGDRVKKGQLLYSVDAQLYTANYNQAVANLNVQEANLVKAQKDADRYRELASKDAVARQLVDNAEAALEVAKKQAEAAKANISGVQTSVRYTKVFAPFNGLIGISQVKTGSPVTAGQTLLNTVSSDNELAVDFNLDQREIFRFGKLLNEKITDSTFTLAFNGEIYSYPGKLAFIDRAVDPQTGAIKARLIFPNNKQLLRAGMNGTVRVKSVSSDQSVLIPYKSVVEQLGEYFVYVKSDSGKASQHKVTLGKQIGSRIIVVEGLRNGDSVVTEGVQNLKEGSAIQSAAPPDEQKKN